MKRGPNDLDEIINKLKKENKRLKKIVADLTIDNSILKEVSRGNY